MDLVSLEELLDLTPLAVVVLLHTIGWALGADHHYHPSRRLLCSVDRVRVLALPPFFLLHFFLPKIRGEGPGPFLKIRHW